MKPFKNEETQKFCEKIAEIYLTGEKEKANIMFNKSVSMMKVARWELIAMQDQIRYLVTKENQNA
ncbi:hypothetical protein KZ558_000612 [Escherichia coli]|nr:hypothetical protein [Escherichia coli]